MCVDTDVFIDTDDHVAVGIQMCCRVDMDVLSIRMITSRLEYRCVDTDVSSIQTIKSKLEYRHVDIVLPAMWALVRWWLWLWLL